MNLHEHSRSWLKMVVPLFTCLALTACGTSEAQIQATATHIAFDIFSTLTASIPTPTNLPAATPTPLPSLTPLASFTPPFDALVNVSVLKVYTEPAIGGTAIYEYSQQDRLAIIGRNRDCSWIQVRTPFGEIGWSNTQLDRITLITPCESLPHGYARPRNGAIVFNNFQKNGYGQLKVNNGRAQDGYVIITDLRENPLLGSYVYAGEEFHHPGYPGRHISPILCQW